MFNDGETHWKRLKRFWDTIPNICRRISIKSVTGPTGAHWSQTYETSKF